MDPIYALGSINSFSDINRIDPFYFFIDIIDNFDVPLELIVQKLDSLACDTKICRDTYQDLIHYFELRYYLTKNSRYFEIINSIKKTIDNLFLKTFSNKLII